MICEINKRWQKVLRFGVILFLISAPFVGRSQGVNEIGVRAGGGISTYKINDSAGFVPNIAADERFGFVTYILRTDLVENKKLSLFYGAGVMSSSTKIRPQVKVTDVPGYGHLEADTLYVARVTTGEAKITVPVEFSLLLLAGEAVSPLFPVPGIRLNIGLEKRLRVGGTKTESSFSYYDTIRNRFTAFEDSKMSSLLSGYYSDKYRSFSMAGNIGLEFFSTGNTLDFKMGMKFNRYLIAPIKHNSNNHLSVLGYLGLSYEIE